MRTITITSDIPGSAPVEVDIDTNVWCDAIGIQQPKLVMIYRGPIRFSTPAACIAAYTKLHQDIEAAREAERRERDDARLVSVPVGTLRKWRMRLPGGSACPLWFEIAAHETDARGEEGGGACRNT